MISFNINDYNYELDSSLIASRPSEDKDNSKLLIYNRKDKSITDTTFKEFTKYIPKDTVIILNDTKVIKARIFGQKESGGKIELLLNQSNSENTFNVYIKGKVQVNNTLLFKDNLKAQIIKLHNDGSRDVLFIQNGKILNQSILYSILENIGTIPLPPYIKRDSNTDDIKDYQSLFAKNDGAIAAPTASLHFSKELFNHIKSTYHISYITLHVGAGTFKGVECDDIREHHMHKEYYELTNNTAKIIDSKRPLLAVGTTSIRSIETYVLKKEKLGYSEIFLYPSNGPKRTDYLITNFHLPKTTLIMLVASMISKDETLRVYEHATKMRYKFFSYGDAMMII